MRVGGASAQGGRRVAKGASGNSAIVVNGGSVADGVLVIVGDIITASATVVTGVGALARSLQATKINIKLKNQSRISPPRI